MTLEFCGADHILRSGARVLRQSKRYLSENLSNLRPLEQVSIVVPEGEF